MKRCRSSAGLPNGARRNGNSKQRRRIVDRTIE
jgi:hypothetical protein